LQLSLAYTLEHYLPLSGRIVPVGEQQQSSAPSSMSTKLITWKPPTLLLGQGRGLLQNLTLLGYRKRRAFRVILCNAGNVQGCIMLFGVILFLHIDNLP